MKKFILSISITALACFCNTVLSNNTANYPLISAYPHSYDTYSHNTLFIGQGDYITLHSDFVNNNNDTVLLPEKHNNAEFYDGEESMLKVIIKDYKDHPFARKQKRACYRRYTKMFLQTIGGQIAAPVVYIGYYANRKAITHRLEKFYAQNNLSNIENIGKDILEGKVTKEDLQSCLGWFYYHLWLYGDTKDPIYSGGVPDDYKPHLFMFVRRWFYSGVRNPRWNATYLNNYTKEIVALTTVYDTRSSVSTSNYGTGNTYLGMYFRWFIDIDGNWWFFYEHTKLNKADVSEEKQISNINSNSDSTVINVQSDTISVAKDSDTKNTSRKKQGKLFYFGIIGLSKKEDGVYKSPYIRKDRFEFSLNRKVSVVQ